MDWVGRYRTAFLRDHRAVEDTHPAIAAAATSAVPTADVQKYHSASQAGAINVILL
jgi:hypothetical protein